MNSPPPTLCVDMRLFSSTPRDDETEISSQRVYEKFSSVKLDGRTKAFSQKETENHSQGKKEDSDYFREINHMTTRLKMVQGKCENLSIQNALLMNTLAISTRL